MQDFTLDFNGLRALACLEKAVFIPDSGILIVSDFHFGKASHFRRSGIAVPDRPEEENLGRLDRLVQRLSPLQIVFSGDMFHSRANQSLERFAAWRSSLPHISIKLVPGNHDILPGHLYQKLGIERLAGDWTYGPVAVCHDPADAKPGGGLLFLAGHLHPGYKLSGPGGETVMLPCLLIGPDVALLPAFGAFTGLSAVRPMEGDKVILFGEKRIYALPNELKKGYAS